MDAAETFRYLLNNKAILDGGIHVNEFVFKTVFYKCGPSYRLCRCAYDHEFLSYVSDNGDVVTGIVDTLTTAIKDGYCPHASRFTDTSYLRPTGINIFHIAAALDSDEMSRTFLPGYHSGKIEIRKLYSEIFQKHPFHISVLKGNAGIATVFAKNNLHSWQWGNRIIIACERQNNVLLAEETSLNEFCIIKRDIKMMGLLYKCAEPAQHNLSARERVYELLFKNNLTDMINTTLDDIMTEYEKWLSSFPYYDPDEPGDLSCYDLFLDVPSIVKLAVMYNQQDIFDKSLQLLSEGWTSLGGNALLTVGNVHSLIMVCEAFKWGNNHKLFSQKELKNLKEAKTVSNFVYLYHLLTHYTSSGLQIKHAMKQLPNISVLINTPFDATPMKYLAWEGLTPLQSYISRPGHLSMEIHVVQTLIELGADIDTVFPQDLVVYNKSVGNEVLLKGGQPLVLHLCIMNEKDTYNKQEWRKILELLLYENVSLDMNKTVVGFGLKHYKDQILYKLRMQVGTTNTMKKTEKIESGIYIMDAELHESALDFAVPLLMEAGFDYARAYIEEAINLPIVPSCDTEDELLEGQNRGIGSGGPLPLEKNHVLEYLGQCLSGPRPLMCLCRNVLRKHFPRRQIHRYVYSVKIPQTIKNYLLLKPLLPTLSDDI